MAVSFDYEYDVDTIHELLTDPQFLVERSLAIGELGADCEIEDEGETTVINLEREVERELPSILAKIFDPIQVLDMTERWRESGDGWTGDWTIQVRGQPVTIMGEFALAPTAAGCRYTVSHSVKARVPLVARQVEKYILSQTQDGARQELQYTADYLAEE
jgi:hypothetical protein